MIVLDGIVANVNGTTGDNWGSINLNSGGFLGLTGASCGVLLRSGTGTYQCQIYTNGVAGPVFPGTTEIRTNRVVITLYVSTMGSAANMGLSGQNQQYGARRCLSPRTKAIAVSTVSFRFTALHETVRPHW
jgi:hypothetical protein